MYYPASDIIASRMSNLADKIRKMDEFLYDRRNGEFEAKDASDFLRIRLYDVNRILYAYKEYGVVTLRTIWRCPMHGEEIKVVGDDLLYCPTCDRTYPIGEYRSITLYSVVAPPEPISAPAQVTHVVQSEESADTTSPGTKKSASTDMAVSQADAVARSMGGLQQLSPDQISLAPTNPQALPRQAVEQEKKAQPNAMMSLLRDPAMQVVISILGIVVTVIIAVVTLNPPPLPSPTPTVTVAPTPATPVVVALRNLDIRSGPGAQFNRIGVLAAEDSLDIRGITDDSTWYQVLLDDGTFGWVLAAESFGRFVGNRSVLRIVTPTATPSLTPSPSDTPTSVPTDTPSPTNTATETPTSTPTLTDTPSETTTTIMTSTDTYAPSLTNVAEQVEDTISTVRLFRNSSLIAICPELAMDLGALRVEVGTNEVYEFSELVGFDNVAHERDCWCLVRTGNQIVSPPAFCKDGYLSQLTTASEVAWTNEVITVFVGEMFIGACSARPRERDTYVCNLP